MGYPQLRLPPALSLSLKHVYEVLRHLVEKDRVEVLFLKETPKKKLF